MKNIAPIIKEGLEKLSKKDLEQLVLKAASMCEGFHDFLLANVAASAGGEQMLFDQTLKDLNALMDKAYKGRAEELRLAAMFAACNKRLALFSKACKNKVFTLDLILYLLGYAFSLHPRQFQTVFTQLNYQVFTLVKKAVTIYNTKLSAKEQQVYQPKITPFLRALHMHSSHLDYVFDFPKTLNPIKQDTNL